MRYFHRAAGAATLAASLALLLGAPATGIAAGRSSPGGMAAREVRFEDDLRACQSLLGGRMAQRRQVAATHPRVAACLQRRGWASDGTPLLVRLVAPG